MAWTPDRGAPNNIRELYHWAYNNFVSAGEGIGNGGGTGSHPDLTERDQADQHPQSAITGLVADQTTQDGRLTTLESDVPTRVLAGYGGIRLNTPTAGTIDNLWNAIPFDAATVGTPVDVTQDFANNALIIDDAGSWLFNVYASIDHNESNQGRQFFLRLYNVTDGVEYGTGTRFAVGRNQPGTNISVVALVDIPVGAEGDLIQVQVGGTSDTFSSVSFTDATFDVTRVSGGATGGGDPGGTNVQAASFSRTGTLNWSNEAGWAVAQEATGQFRVTFPSAASALENQAISANRATPNTTTIGVTVNVTELTATNCLIEVRRIDTGVLFDNEFTLQRVVG